MPATKIIVDGLRARLLSGVAETYQIRWRPYVTMRVCVARLTGVTFNFYELSSEVPRRRGSLLYSEGRLAARTSDHPISDYYYCTFLLCNNNNNIICVVIFNASAETEGITVYRSEAIKYLSRRLRSKLPENSGEGGLEKFPKARCAFLIFIFLSAVLYASSIQPLVNTTSL